MTRGSLVKWYTVYNEMIVRDAGYGIVVEVKTSEHDNIPYGADVLRGDPHNDLQSFPLYDLEIISV
tara:strand:+ start:273 stop:470 length:198 start_codon:yes stop_codon:yes gene_type:complete